MPRLMPAKPTRYSFFSQAALWVRGVVLVFFVLFSQDVFSQTTGDYRSNAASMNWSDLASWQRFNGSTWAPPTAVQGYPGQFASTGQVTIIAGHSVTVNVSNAACALLRINNAATSGTNTLLTINDGQTLTVGGGTGTVTIGSATGMGNGSANTTSLVVNGNLISGTINQSPATRNSGSGGSGNTNLTINATGIVTVTGNVSGTTVFGERSTQGTASVIFSGAGVLNLSGTFTTSVFTPSTGTVNYNNNGAQTVRDTGYNNLTLSGSGTKTVTGVTVNGILSREGTASLSVAPTYGASATLQYNTSSASTVGPEWPATWANASNGVIVRGTGIITLNGDKALSTRPLTVVAGATLAVGSNTLAGVSTLNLEVGGSTGSTISGTGLITLAGNISVTDIAGGAGGATISAPVELGGARTITVANGTSATDLTISGVISGSTFGLTKAGAGTLVLSGANTYTGATTVNGGTLRAGRATNAFGANSAVTLANTAGVILDITGFNTTIGSLTGGGSTGGNVTLGAATLTIGTNNSSPAAFAGVISGTGSLTKSGTGVLTLSGNNTYTGATTISEGVLQLGAANRIATSNFIMNGGTFRTGATTGFEEGVGTLNVTENSTIALGTGPHTLTFSASNGTTWTANKTILITGWQGTAGLSGTSGKIVVGDASGTLTADQLSRFRFAGYNNGAIQLATGEVVPPGAPTITSLLTASSTYGSAASYAITAANSPTSFAAANLPTGMSINTATGEITVAATTNAGTYNITISATNTSGSDSKTLAYTVNKVVLTITANDQSVTYGTSVESVTGNGSYTATGFVNNEDSSVIDGSATYTTTYTATTAAGTLGVTITPVVTGLTATNYSFTPANGTVTISKANSTITTTGTTTFTYTGAAQGPSSSDVTGSAGTVNFSYSGSGYGPSATRPTNAGTYQVVATVAADANFNGATSDLLAFTINKAVLTITADDQNVEFGTAESTVTGAGTYTATGFVNNEDSSVIDGSVTYTTTYTATTAAGTLGVTITPVVTGLTATNYSFTPANGTITISKANSTITATGTTTFTYTGAPQGPSSSTKSGSTGEVAYSYSGTGSTSYGPSTTPPTNAGSYQVIAILPADANFNGATSDHLAFTINKAVLTITADDQNVEFGTSESTVTGAGTYTATGFVNNEDSSVIDGSATYTTTYTATTAAGTAGVTITPVVTGLTATNYSFITANGTVTISKANSTITATGTTTFTYTGEPQGPFTSDKTGSQGAVTYSYLGTVSTSYGPSSTRPTNAGTYQVIATVAADANFNEATSAPLAFTINKANSTITATGTTTFTYTGEPQGPADSNTTGSGGVVTYSYSGSEYGPSTIPPTNAGSYTVIASIASDENFNEASSSALGFTIAKATSTVIVRPNTNSSFTFTGNPKGPEVSDFDFTGSTGERTLVYRGTGTTSYSGNTPPSNEGTYEVIASVAADENHEGASSEGFSFTISGASSTVIVKDGTVSEFTYTGAAQGPGLGDFNFIGSEGARSILYSGTGSTVYSSPTPPVNAGTYEVVASVEADATYFAASSSPFLFSIAKASTTTVVTLSQVQFTYSGESFTPASVTVTGPGLSLTPAATYSDNKNAGTATASYEYPGDDNYLPSSDTKTFEIAQIELSLTADAKSKVYGSIDPELTYRITSGALVGGDVLTGALSREAGEDVGQYEISIGTLVNSNYSITFVGAELTITPLALTVTADAQTKVYGDADPALTYQVTGTLSSGDSFTGSLARVAGENVGTYVINQGSLAVNANYDITFVGANLTITTRAITITADAKSKVYGNADPALTYQITSGSLAFTDSFSGSLSRATGENIGTYAITQGSVALNSNYALSYVGADLTITTRAITITADAKTKVYGDADPALTYQITTGSLASGDSFSGSLSRAMGENVGTYAITQGSLVLNSNYALTFVGANLTITSRAITVTADAKSKEYGSVDPELTYQITSGTLASGDSFSGSLTRVEGENVGNYAITLGTLALNSNYTLTFVSANLTIGAKAITVTADSQTKVYGADDPTLIYQITLGNLVDGDVLSGSLTRASGENVGNYQILLGSLANANYSITFVTANFSITPKTLVITPNTGQSKQEGADDPTLTYQASGWEFSDNTNLLTGALSRVAGEVAGTYAITLGTLAVSGSNYVISFTGGVTFAILERPAVKLAFVASPAGSSTEAGQPFATQPVVQIQNELGGIVASANTPVTLSLLEGSGELRGVVTLEAVNGVATFSGLNIDLVGADKRLFAEAVGLESDSTATFTISPAPAALFTKYVGDQQVAQVGSAVETAPAVRIQDLFGNPISNVSVSFAVTSGGGSIAPTTAVVTDSDGIATLTSWTLGTTAGQNVLTASTSGFSELTFTALGSEDLIATITSSGNWTVPPGVTEITVEGWGGGGAGGSVIGDNKEIRAAAGGGGGAYARKKLQVTPGQVLSLQIGQGGSSPTSLAPSNGGDTFITGLTNQFFAKGGSGGAGHGGPAPGLALGGSAIDSRGDVVIAGSNGGPGSSSGNSGAGGNAANGGGLGGASVSSVLSNGINGQVPGGGGSGARVDGANRDRLGGSGGSGRIVITYPKPVNQFRAATSGNWEDNATWEQQFSNGQFAKINTKPEANSTVIISKPGVSVQGAPATVTVTVSQDLNFTGSITVTSEGELALAAGKNLTLTSGSRLTIGNEGILTLPSNGLVLGGGNVAINKGSILSIAHPEGVKASGTAGGAIQNTGTRTFSNEANYHYNGTSAQVIGNGLPEAVNGLIIDNPDTVTLDRPLDVVVDLEVNSGVLELNETLTVDLGMELKGSSRLLVKAGKKFQADLLADLTTGGSSRIVLEPGAKYLNLGIGTPRLEVQQRLNGAKGWRMLGAPVAGESYGGFLNKLETQGYTGAKNPTLQPNVLWWDEEEAGTTVQGWRKPTDSTDVVPAGRGHYVFVFNGEAKKVANTGNYSDALPITLSAIGNEVNLNNGGFNFRVTFTERTNKFKGNSTDKDYSEAGDADEGFNLIANPTASFIDFFKSGWTKTNIDSTIYVWDQNFNTGQGAFRLFTSDTPPSQRIIAPYQGFWVRTNAANPSLIMTNNAKEDEFSTFFGRVLEEKPVTPASQIRLNVAGEGLKAEASVRVSEEGQDGLDPWDAFQLESLDNNWLNLYTLGSPKELTPLAINHLSLPTEGEKTIPLYLAAAKNGKPFSGTYTLNWDLPTELTAGAKVVLMDHISKKAIDMSEVQSYTFSFEAPISTNARIRDEEGEMKQPQAVVFSHEIKDGEGENYRTAAGKVTRPFTLVIGYTGQGTNPEYRPETPKLFAPSPNPFEEMTQVKFYLPVTEEVEVKIYDMKGQEVGGFARKAYPAGINVLEWRPTAVHLPKGVYLIQVQTETMVMTQKAIKL
jgi:large repetitive protein